MSAAHRINICVGFTRSCCTCLLIVSLDFWCTQCMTSPTEQPSSWLNSTSKRTRIASQNTRFVSDFLVVVSTKEVSFCCEPSSLTASWERTSSTYRSASYTYGTCGLYQMHTFLYLSAWEYISGARRYVCSPWEVKNKTPCQIIPGWSPAFTSCIFLGLWGDKDL